MSIEKVYLLVFLVIAFSVGTGYGVYLMSLHANNLSGVNMSANASEFPALKNTTTPTTTTLTKNTTKTTTATKKSATKNSTTSTKKMNNNNTG